MAMHSDQTSVYGWLSEFALPSGASFELCIMYTMSISNKHGPYTSRSHRPVATARESISDFMEQLSHPHPRYT